jgi:hypothetical protein
MRATLRRRATTSAAMAAAAKTGPVHSESAGDNSADGVR